MRYKIIPVFIPHASCPNHCIFCNQNEITGINGYDLDSVKGTIESYISHLGEDQAHREIAFYGGSFTAIEPDTQEILLTIAKGYIDEGVLCQMMCLARTEGVIPVTIT